MNYSGYIKKLNLKIKHPHPILKYMMWHPVSRYEKVENGEYITTYKFVTKYPNPILWFLYRTYHGAIEALGYTNCEGCEKWISKDQIFEEGYCEACHEYRFCECGQLLEDSYGSPGDGFCRMCQ